MSGITISREFLDAYEPPEVPDGFTFFTVAMSEVLGGDEGAGWVEDRTRVTTDPAIAFAWAVLLAGMADDGENPQPLARVTAFAVDPLDVTDWEEDAPAEHVTVFVDADGVALLPGDEDEGDALLAEIADWPEVYKTFG